MKLIQRGKLFKGAKIEATESEYLSYKIGFVNGIGTGFVVGSILISIIIISILMINGIIK